MQQILIYSDSLSWGIIPNTRLRLSFSQRWPGVLEQSLIEQKKSVRIVENCLNGRRTVWDDPFKAGRNGCDTLAQVIEMHSPLKLIVLMLGTNDFQNTHDNNAQLASHGIVKLINIVRSAAIEPGMSTPEILIICPPTIVQAKGAIASKFTGAEQRCLNFSSHLKNVSDEQDCYFLDANSITAASSVDGIHLDADQHLLFGNAVADFIASHIEL